MWITLTVLFLHYLCVHKESSLLFFQLSSLWNAFSGSKILPTESHLFLFCFVFKRMREKLKQKKLWPSLCCGEFPQQRSNGTLSDHWGQSTTKQRHNVKEHKGQLSYGEAYIYINFWRLGVRKKSYRVLYCSGQSNLLSSETIR